MARLCYDILRHFTRGRHLLYLGNETQNPRRGNYLLQQPLQLNFNISSRLHIQVNGVKKKKQMWKWQKKGRIYLAGELALITAQVIWITALPQIRRKWFQLFYYTHHLYIVFFVFFLFHCGDRHFYMVFPGVFLFALDKLLRVIQSRQETCVLSARVFPCRAIELTLPKDSSKSLNFLITVMKIICSRKLRIENYIP